jgi:hypothetical protein
MNNSHIRTLVALFVIIALLPLLAHLGKAVGNTYHQNQASGILSMAQCLKCHDGVTGSLITVCLGNQCLYLKNHSLMHVYPPVVKTDEYASRAEIEQAGCILEDGRVTCLSCHDLTRPAPHLIRDGDQLCLICHKARRGKGQLMAATLGRQPAGWAVGRRTAAQSEAPGGIMGSSLELLRRMVGWCKAVAAGVVRQWEQTAGSESGSR